MPRRVFECICDGCDYKSDHSRNFLRHLKGRSHKADETLLARANAYVKGEDSPPPFKLPPPVQQRVLPDPPRVKHISTQTEPGCMEELVAIRIDNAEYRDYFPTVALMIAAAERLDAYEDVFESPKHMQEYLKRLAPERRPASR